MWEAIHTRIYGHAHALCIRLDFKWLKTPRPITGPRKMLNSLPARNCALASHTELRWELFTKDVTKGRLSKFTRTKPSQDQS